MFGPSSLGLQNKPTRFRQGCYSQQRLLQFRFPPQHMSIAAFSWRTLGSRLLAVSGPARAIPGKLRLVPVFLPPPWAQALVPCAGTSPHRAHRGRDKNRFPLSGHGLRIASAAWHHLATPIRAALICLIHSPHHARTVGRFVLSPITRQTDSGQFAASLSIRSGQGSASHDRVYRFTPLFTTAQAAAHYALDQGLSYLRQPALPA